ncbi:hypothetical protein FRC05_001960 [Tulasnella sp. 425]|nr:hypothetical protein FRC05_001960 [Tulasnella sp. 425]
MDFYFTLSSAASTASKPEEIVIINQDDGTGGDYHERNQREGGVIKQPSLSLTLNLYVSEWVYNELRIARSMKPINSSLHSHPHLSSSSQSKTQSTQQMDSYFSFTSFASTSATSKPEEVVIVDQEGGSGGGNGYCTIA